MTANGLFSIDDLRLYFRTRKGPVQAVDGVSLTLPRGRTVVIVGESGCGKSSLARAILRLLPRNVARYSGSVRLNGLDVMTLPEEQFRQQVRWIRLAWVPQGAMNSLNPVIRIGDQVAEPLLAHRRSTRRAWRPPAGLLRRSSIGLGCQWIFSTATPSSSAEACASARPWRWP